VAAFLLLLILHRSLKEAKDDGGEGGRREYGERRRKMKAKGRQAAFVITVISEIGVILCKDNANAPCGVWQNERN